MFRFRESGNEKTIIKINSQTIKSDYKYDRKRGSMSHLLC